MSYFEGRWREWASFGARGRWERLEWGGEGAAILGHQGTPRTNAEHSAQRGRRRLAHEGR